MNPTWTDLAHLDPFPALARARSAGAAFADVFVEEVLRSSVRLERGQIKEVTRDRDRGIAVRAVMPSGQTRFATATRIDRPTLEELASDVASGTREPGAAGDRSPAAAPTFLCTAADLRPEAFAVSRKIQLVELGDRVARGVSSDVKQVSVALRDGVRRTAIAASDGRLIAVEHVRVIFAIEVIAANGDQTQSSFEAIGGAGGFDLATEAAIERTARITAERAVRMLHAEPAAGGVMPVVLAAEAGGTFVHEAVGHSLEADLVLDGLSALGERIGERVAAPSVTVIDDATMLHRNGSFLADDEGVNGQRTVLIDRGILVSLLHDQRTALLMGAASTGQGRRESFRHRPIVRMSNTMIAPGPDDPAAIIRDTERGLYVVRMGGGEVDTVTGQFVFEVNEAYRIEHGAVSAPVRGATLAGDAAEVLLAIDRVGSDLGFGIGTCGKDGQDVPISDGEPTIRIPSLVVGGS